MDNYGSSNPSLTEVTFTSNSAANDGGGMNNNGSQPTLTDVTFTSNSAPSGHGGGMYNYQASPTVRNVTFSSNSAKWGGGVHNFQGSPSFTNVTFSGNSASDNGGGMGNQQSSPVVTNVTFSGNSATNRGGGMDNYDSSNPQIRNTIFWGDMVGEIANVTNSNPVVSYSVVQGGYSGTGNLSTDPKLGPLGSYGGFTPTVPLYSGSSAINATSTSCPGTDQRGVTRGSTCDIGAYEYSVYAGIHYVKQTASGMGDCSSWENACTLQTALVSSSSGSEIWVAAGTYKPITIPDRNATFQLVNGVAVYGGFAGDESQRGDRHGGASVLSGDIDNNDSQTPIITNLATVTGNTTNSYHVVTGATGATFDGFTITAGYANSATFPNERGGGMYNGNSSPTVANVTFRGNFASTSGGGMANYQSSPTITNVTFSGNRANWGGGMDNYGGSPVLTEVTFTSNSAANDGGGMNNNGSQPTLTDVTFTGNSAPSGHGGGMYNYQASPTVRNVTFDGNSAKWGGGVHNFQGSPSFTNVTFSGNSAIDNGGGMGNQQSSPMVTNVTFSGNNAPDGGGMHNYDNSNPQIRNTILWGNTGSTNTQISNVTNSNPVVSYSVVQGGYDGPGNLSTDPKLEALGNNGGFTKTFKLRSGSSAINTGNDLICSAAVGAPNYGAGGLDQRGVTRPQPVGGHCDIGAYEFEGYFGTYYVKPGGTGDCHNSWANACDLVAALDKAAYGDVIWVATGTYKPTTGTDRNATFLLKNRVAVYGGFDGVDDAVLGDRNPDPTTNNTILSGDIGAASRSDNSYHVVTGVTGATLDGFTIKRGYADGTSPNDAGGGMFNYQSSPTIANVIFSSNFAKKYGGGMFNYQSNPTITDVTFSGNTGDWLSGARGGGMANYQSSPTINNVTFYGNGGVVYGGGIYIESGSPTLTNVTFDWNGAYSLGGGMCNNGGDLTLINITFSNNHAELGKGGGLYTTGGDSLLINITFSGNDAGDRGGAIYLNSGDLSMASATITGNDATNEGGGLYINGGSAYVQNSIFWRNTAQLNDEICINLLAFDFSWVEYSIIYGICPLSPWLTCKNNFDADTPGGHDPKLGSLGDYGGSTQTIPILPGSKAIDNAFDYSCYFTDQRGVPRPQGPHCDIGAFEYAPPSHTISGSAGVAGATIHYGQASTTAGSDGSYSVSVYERWTGTVTPSKPGYVFSPASRSYTNVTANITGENYTAASGYDISGNAGVAGATITYDGGSTASGDDGSYLITVPVGGWSGTVTPSKTGYTFTPASRTYSNVTGNISGENYTATPIEYTLTITSEHGTVTKTPNQATYHEGDVVQLSVTPDICWRFSHWSGDLTGSANPGFVTIHGNTSVTANYLDDFPDLEVQSDTLGVTCAADGQVTVSGTVTMVNTNCGANLTADIPVRFTLYDNTDCSGNQLLQWTQTFTGVNIASGGGTQAFTITPQNATTNICTNSSGCQVSILVEADYDATIIESDGTNNTRCSNKTVSVPDLTINSVTPAFTCVSDGNPQGTVTVNVSNTGCGPANGAVVRLTSDCGIVFADQTINLAAGSSTNVTFNYTPVCTACTCTFTAEVDPDTALCECDGTNNSLASAPFTMTVPDIEVQSDTLAITCAADNQVTVSGTVTLVNNGCGTNLTADIPMRFTLFDNTGCAVSGNQLGQWTQTFTGVDIASGGGTQVFTITPETINTDLCANSTNCQVSIRVEADYSGTVCECDGTDNTYCADNKAVDVPDLGVTNDTLSVACSGDGEFTVSGDVTLANNGCGSNLTANIPMRFTIFDNTGCGGNQIAQWAETLSSVNIAADGGTQVFSITPYDVTANLCTNSTNCQVSIRVEADYSDSICECDGTDNTLCTDESLTTPDLAINSVTPSSGPNGNGMVTVNVGNTGCGNANGAVVRLISDCGLAFTDQTIDLAASASENLAFNFFTADCGDCICTFTASIDPGNAICECSGANNSQQITSGTMTIVKDAVPNGPQDFHFTGDLGDFDLDDDPGDATLPNSATFMRPSGTYSITETVPFGWVITNIVCDDGSPTYVPGATASIDLAAGEAVTCTFTNEVRLDYGDAPDPSYPTLLAGTGARHRLGTNVYLGACVDAEADGRPSANADSDDTAAGSPVFGTCVGNDDEDGVSFFTSVLRIGVTAKTRVVANAACHLSAWIDFNADGDWADANETIFSGQPLVAGANSLSFVVPGTAVVGTTYARFRCTTDGAVTFTGPASDGEVEDYQVRIKIPTPCSADLDGNWWVNTADLSILISQWGRCAGCAADLNGNGWVNTADLSILISQWGECP